MTSDGKPDHVKVERDHPQTRRIKPYARGSSKWREDVLPPEGEREEGAEKGDKPVWAPGEEPLPKTDEQAPLSGPIGEMAKDAEAVRTESVGEEKARHAFGSDKAGVE